MHNSSSSSNSAGSGWGQNLRVATRSPLGLIFCIQLAIEGDVPASHIAIACKKSHEIPQLSDSVPIGHVSSSSSSYTNSCCANSKQLDLDTAKL